MAPSRTISFVVVLLIVFVMLPKGIWSLLVDGEFTTERWWNPFLFEQWLTMYSTVMGGLDEAGYAGLSRGRKFFFWCKVFWMGLSSLVFYMIVFPFKLLARCYIEFRQVAAKVDFRTKKDAENPDYVPINGAPVRPPRSASRVPSSVSITLPPSNGDEGVTPRTHKVEVAFVDAREDLSGSDTE